MLEDPLYDKYCSKLPVGMADQIITSARMEHKLEPGTPLIVANPMEIVCDISGHATSHPAIMAMPVSPGVNIVPPNATAIPTPYSPELMHLTVAYTNTRFHCCEGVGHEACNGVTPYMWGCVQTFCAQAGRNRSWQVGGDDHSNTYCGGPGMVATSVARSINNVKVAAVEEARMNNNGENPAVEQNIVNEDDGEGTGNWKLWWNILLPRL